MTDAAGGHFTLNPHFFNYPSLSIYLHLISATLVYALGHLLGVYHSYADFLLYFQIDPTPVVVAARLLHIIADLATVCAIYKIGQHFSQSAAWLAMSLVACSPTLINTQRFVIVDTLAAAFLSWSIVYLFSWLTTATPYRLYVSAVLLGAAASTKYPAIVALAPMLLIVALHSRSRTLRDPITLIMIATLTFLLTSPYVLLDGHAALRDITFERSHLAIGHLGSQNHPSAKFHLNNLLANLGPVGLAALFTSPILLIRATSRSSAALLLLIVLLFVAPILLVHHDAERYLVPAIPLAGVLVGATAAAFITTLRTQARAPLWSVLFLVILLPVGIKAFSTASAGIDDTQRRALQWCLRNIPSKALIIRESGSVPLPSALRKGELAAMPLYNRSSPYVRKQVDRLPVYHVVDIPVRVTGVLPNLPDSYTAEQPAAIDLNQAYYTPRLYAAADYIITSTAVRGRYEAEPRRFSRQLGFYAMLDRSAVLSKVFVSSRAVSGPTIRIYRITPSCSEEMRRDTLPDMWWIAWMEERMLRSLAPIPGGQWLQRVYDDYVRQFAGDLALETFMRGDTLTAEWLWRDAIQVDPTDIATVLPYSLCLGARGAWSQAQAVLQRALDPESPNATLVMLQLSRVERHLARPDQQRHYLLEIRLREPITSPIRKQAELEFASLSRPK